MAKDYKLVPVSTFIAISLIVIFLLFNAKVVTSIPCGKSIHDVFMSNFVHIDTVHLISNLFALYAVSRVEMYMGFQPFICLLIFLLIFNTLAEVVAKRLFTSLNCSIGFSGILFGFMTWELASQMKVDVELVIAITIMIAGPSIQHSNVSLSGHLIGAISGVIAALLWKSLNKH